MKVCQKLQSTMDNLETTEDKAQFSILIQRLADQKIITISEQEQINAKEDLSDRKSTVFDLLERKDWLTALNILSEVKCSNSEICDVETKFLKPVGYPMEASMVIHRICGYLSLEQIKQCRLINKKWSEVAVPFLEKRCKIVFVSSDEDKDEDATDVEGDKRLISFIETFRNSLVAINFTEFHFEGYGGWSIAELTEFFSEAGSSAEALVFNDAMVEKENYEDITPFDISSLISTLKIKKLEISYDSNEEDYAFAPKLCVSIGQLEHLEHLELLCCDVIITENVKISPKTILLFSVNFHQNGNLIKRFCINEAVDFERADVIRFFCNDHETVFVLDVNNDHSVSEIVLDGVSIINTSTENLKWNIKKLKWVDGQLKTANLMEVKHLLFGNGVIDLSILPEKLEKLDIWRNDCREIPVHVTKVICTGPLHLPHLMSLRLCRVASSYFHFVNCQNIVHLELSDEGAVEDTFEIEADTLPKTLKILKLTDIDIIKGENVFPLDRLIMIGYTFIRAEDHLQFLKPKIFALRWCSTGSYETNEGVFRFLDQHKHITTAIIGPFYFESLEWFEGSIFEERCGEMAHYYFFEICPDDGDESQLHQGMALLPHVVKCAFHITRENVDEIY